jgi:hypothetical protein
LTKKILKIDQEELLALHELEDSHSRMKTKRRLPWTAKHAAEIISPTSSSSTKTIKCTLTVGILLEIGVKSHLLK